MSLQNRAKLDMQRFTADDTGFFAVECVVKHPDGLPSINVKGLHTRHWMGFDPDGVAVHTVIASLGVSEQQFIDGGFAIRDVNGEVDLKGHLIDAPDSNGVVKNYVLREVFPDENLGLLILMLGEYQPAGGLLDGGGGPGPGSRFPST